MIWCCFCSVNSFELQNPAQICSCCFQDKFSVFWALCNHTLITIWFDLVFSIRNLLAETFNGKIIQQKLFYFFDVEKVKLGFSKQSYSNHYWVVSFQGLDDLKSVWEVVFDSLDDLLKTHCFSVHLDWIQGKSKHPRRDLNILFQKQKLLILLHNSLIILRIKINLWVSYQMIQCCEFKIRNHVVSSFWIKSVALV